ncbi:toprim domain-containing protein [Akkermansia muciniphila]|uniref:toprim domain-containing protein n=1 Tax=Akkermansia muciniphila TaxID=239935 RepID=UPI00211E4E85|nr:toprim domain-containing protein [Akkermansia muciniphila]
MSKTLIIAEKPSVATDLARVLGKELGKFTRDKSGAFYQNDRAIITSAVGHLLEQKKTHDGRRKVPAVEIRLSARHPQEV